MMGTLRCWILCVLLVLATTESSQIFYVRPMLLQYNFTCPSQPCLTISEYARESHRYFLSNSTFMFMPGDHILDTQLRIENISEIVLSRSMSQVGSTTRNNFEVAQIICTNDINIRCMNVSKFCIFSLTFVTCGIRSDEIPGLTFINSNGITIVDTSFHGNVVSALGIRHSEVYNTNCTFLNNKARAGSAIYAESSNLTFSGNNSFVGNTAEVGGAIYLLECSVYFTGQNNFSFNSALNGIFRSGGGAIAIVNSTLIITGDSYFNHNAVLWNGNISFSEDTIGGGAIFTLSSLLVLRGTVVFTRNVSPDTGAVYIQTSRLLMNGTVIFDSNNAFYRDSGAVTIILESSFINYGRLVFSNNIAVHFGGAISVIGRMRSLNEMLLLGSTEFSNNSVTDYINSSGGAAFMEYSSIKMANVVFINNTSPLIAGAIHVIKSNVSIGGLNSYVNNVADSAGAFNADTCNITFSGSNHFKTNIAYTGSGVIQFLSSDITINGDMTFFSNRGKWGGGISTLYSTLQIDGHMTFISNVAGMYGGSIAILYGSITFAGYNIFINNRAYMQGGAMYAEGSKVKFQNTVKFINNSAQLGGALAFSGGSTLNLVSPIYVYSFNNRAHAYGGVIYQDDIVTSSQCNPPSDELKQINMVMVDCYLSIEVNIMRTLNASFLFQNDSAGLAGKVMFGGLLDMCRMKMITNNEASSSTHYINNPLDVLSHFFTLIPNDNSTSVISSDPFRLCFCENDIPDCDIRINTSMVSGQQIIISALAVGQFNMSVPTTVTAILTSNARLDTLQRFQQTGKQCTTLRYRIFSPSSYEELILYPDGPCRDSGIARQVVNVTLLPCPDGFTLSDSDCVCEERLRRFTTNCTIGNTFSIIRSSESTFWMDELTINGTYEGLILHPSCPFDYCVSTPVAITLDNLDIQCDLNRTGTLCGTCQTNLSLIFGSSQCKSCSNYYLFLIIPFALAGILLVILLLGLRLTVASGTLNGLIFYTNIVQVNHHIFFPTGETNVLTVFIAWLNLDLGIETCFYDEMDAYARTWLQFVFPLYLWFLIGLIIVMSRYSQRIAKAFGSNPVAVLATLLLMSYAKLLRTIITDLGSTNLEYPDGSFVTVWLHDGNVKYFQLSRPSHFVLVITSLLTLIFFFLPYTILLLLGPWIYRYSDTKFFSWLNRIKPFMDAYSAPYKKNNRYWTGFLLLIRCGLFLTFAFSNSNLVNLVSISSVLAGLAAIVWLSGSFYEKQYLNILEISLITNLYIFAVATYHINANMKYQRILAYTLVGIVFCTFIAILIFHSLLLVNKTVIWQKIPHSKLTKYFEIKFGNKSMDSEEDLDTNSIQDDRGPTELEARPSLQLHPDTGSIALQEPLLKYRQ